MIGEVNDIAIKRIEKASISKSHSLDLSDLNKNEIPKEIRMLAGQLTSLSLRNNNIKDLSPLSSLVNLQDLNLFNNQIEDTSPLAKLINLTGLSLRNNLVKDISPISNLINLQTLDIRNNQVQDISSLAKYSKLINLYVQHNRIIDITPLSGLKHLSGLFLENNLIRTIPRNFFESRKTLFTFQPIDELMRGCHFYGNPLQSPPPEILVLYQNAIIDYFNHLKVFVEPRRLN